MRLFLSMLSGLALCIGSVQAQQEQFLQAQTAYDHGRYAEAALQYETLIEQGTANPEVHYNLANAYFKDRDLPKAVWHYRKAWYEMPRDPDLKANLHFALNAAGALDPTPSFANRILSTLSQSEWIITATSGYLLLLILLLLLPIKAARRMVLKLCLLPLGILTLSGLGWLQWNQLKANPEYVVVQAEATALFGPIAGSTAHFKMPIGALVRQRSNNGKGWIKVEYDHKQGWLKREYIALVSP
ncbi:MAG: tetratricopeptide repeat protein [Pontiella sp.]